MSNNEIFYFLSLNIRKSIEAEKKIDLIKATLFSTQKDVLFLCLLLVLGCHIVSLQKIAALISDCCFMNFTAVSFQLFILVPWRWYLIGLS